VAGHAKSSGVVQRRGLTRLGCPLWPFEVLVCEAKNGPGAGLVAPGFPMAPSRKTLPHFPRGLKVCHWKWAFY
jgi:hypothetical protein